MDAYHASKSAIEEGEAEIAQLTGQVDQLTRRINTIRSAVQQHRANMAPIHILPDEILSMVFGLLRPCTCICDETVFRVIAVCRRWRLLAMSCPQLWVEVIFDMDSLVRVDKNDESDDEDFDDYPKSIQLSPISDVSPLRKRIDLQLEHSRPRTLDVTLLIGDLDDSEDEGLPEEWVCTLQRAIEETIQNVHRCHRLVVGGNIPATWDSYPRNPPVFHSLETLHVRDLFWSWLDQEHFLNKANTPLLSHLRLSDMTFSSVVLDSFDWGNVRSLALQNCDIEPRSLLALLRRAATTLASLEIDGLHCIQMSSPTPPLWLIRLPKLQKAEFGSTGSVDASVVLDPILSRLAAPDLAHLTLGNIDGFRIHTIDAFQQFFNNCGSWDNLRTLRFEMFSYTRNLSTFLKFEGIVNLTIGWVRNVDDSIWDIDALLANLTWTPDVDKRPKYRFYPNLTRLTLRGFGAMTPKVLENMVRSRARGVVGECREGSPAILEKFALENTKFPDPQPDMTWLRDMEKQGLINV